MSDQDPFPAFPPRRAPDWPALVTNESLLTPASYPVSINDRSNAVTGNESDTRPPSRSTGHMATRFILGLLGVGIVISVVVVLTMVITGAFIGTPA